MKRLLSFSAVVCLVAGPALAGVDVWTSTWPATPAGIGLQPTQIAVDPSDPRTLYAASGLSYGDSGNAQALSRSTDEGASWAQLSAVNPVSIAIDPRFPATLYAAPGGSGISKSTDRGETWAVVGQLPNFMSVLALDPSAPSTLYVAGQRVFKTIDGGESWFESAKGLPFQFYSTLAVMPSSPSVLFAASYDDVFRSTNGGVSWDPVVGSHASPQGVQAFAFDSLTPAIVYAASLTRGVLKSTDGGTTWIATNGGLPTVQVSTLVTDPAHPSTLYVGTVANGIYRSVNGGVFWSPFNEGLGPGWVTALAIDASGRFLHAGTSRQQGAIYDIEITDAPPRYPQVAGIEPRSVDAGAAAFTLTVLGAGFIPGSVVRWNGTNRLTTFVSDRELHALISASDLTAPGSAHISVMNPLSLTSATDLVFTVRALDGSERWVSTGPPGVRPFSLAASLSRPGVLYTGTNGGVYRSRDGGATWVPAGDGLGVSGGSVSILVIDPVDPDSVYAASGGSVYRTRDGGANWSLTSAGLPASVIRSLAIDPSDRSRVYAGSSDGLYRSTDQGNSWRSAGGELAGLHVRVDAVAVDKLGAVYAADPARGVFKSVDGGSTWAFVLSRLSSLPVHTILPSPLDPSIVYVDGGARSTDGGRTWTGSPVGVVALDPNDSSSVFRAFAGASLLRTVNGGSTWKTLGEPLLGTPLALALDADSRTLYAATTEGVFRLSIPMEAAPILTSITPNVSLPAGGPITVTARGSGFSARSVVRWNGSPRPTILVTNERLNATIEAADLTAPGEASVTVTNPLPGGGVSDSLPFTVLPANPKPSISTLSPAFAAPGDPDMALTVLGHDFVSGSVVLWNGEARPTIFVSPERLDLRLTQADLAQARAVVVTVSSPGPGGGESGPAIFSIIRIHRVVPSDTVGSEGLRPGRR